MQTEPASDLSIDRDAATPAPDLGLAEIDRWARLAQFMPEQGDVEWVCRAAAKYLDAQGAIPLARLMRLPVTPLQFRRTRRNRALLAAAAEVDPALGPWSAAVHLEAQLKTFKSRGPWERWCKRGEAPANATPMERALFDCLVMSGGKRLRARQIAEVLRSISIKKLRADVPMIEVSEADDAPRSTKGNKP